MSPVSKIKLNSYDDLFGESSIRGDIKDVLLEDLYPFKNHPFEVNDDESLQEMVASIKEYGVLEPGIARPRDAGGYELISGHRRKFASQLAGCTTMPVLIREWSDDEATVMMVDANIQRDNIKPSEKAKAYKMKYDAIKHQGLAGTGTSLDTLGAIAGESGKTVQRYIWLARLSDNLLKLVDSGKLKFGQAIDISFLKPDEQKWVWNIIDLNKIKVTVGMSSELKRNSKAGLLTEVMSEEILLKEEPDKSKVLAISQKKLRKYFAEDQSNEQMEQVIISLLEAWKNKVISV